MTLERCAGCGVIVDKGDIVCALCIICCPQFAKHALRKAGKRMPLWLDDDGNVVGSAEITDEPPQ